MTSAYRSQKGRDAEVQLMGVLAEQNFLVASRRHIGGAGDILAVRPYAMARLPNTTQRPIHEVWLIEVKQNGGSPYLNFRPEHRAALKKTARDAGAVPLLAWRPNQRAEWTFKGEDEWPKGQI